MTQYLDSRGHGLTTSNEAAAAAFNAGMRGFICWRTDTMDHLDAAMAADPEFALPKLAKGWVLQTARTAAFRPVIEDLLADAAPLIEAASAREQAYFHSLIAAAGGHGVAAATIMEAMLAQNPTDLLAHRLVQFELFWNGRAAWMRDLIERAAPAWNKDLADYGGFLSARAFANEEGGNYELAERCGRDAVEIDPTDCWGTHAVAHVHAMQGRVDDGVAWLEGLNGNWGEANQIAHHLWWHLCIMLLEQGAHDRVKDLLTSRIRNPDSPLVKAMPGAPIDLQNVASMTMRLELRGVDVADSWGIFAEICAGRINDHGSPFSAAHDMLVLTGSGQFDLAETLLDNMRAFAATGDGSLVTAYRAAGIPLCEAILAYRRGEYEQAIALLSPVRHDLHLIGGSHAQRDLFYQILLDAAHRTGRRDLIPLYFDDIRRIGFDRVEQRTFYRDIAA